MGYATLADFQTYGLRREVLLPRRRTIASVDVDADVIEVPAHGYAGDEFLQVSAVNVGDTPTLPGGLSASVVYRPLPVDGSDDLFKLSLTFGGSAVDITDEGAGSLVITEQLGARIQKVLDMTSSLVDEAIVNYAPELPAPVPPVVVWVVCKLAAYDIAVSQGLVHPEYWEQARETIKDQADLAQKYLADWRAGKPIQKLIADATPGVAENGAVVLSPSASPWFRTVNGHEAIG